MAYSLEIKENAIELRKAGFSIKEISRKFNISQSTASLWLSDVSLSKAGIERLSKRIKSCQIISAKKRKEKTAERIKSYLENGLAVLKKSNNSKADLKIFCSLLYYCEGAKNICFQFTNSDPNLIKTFLFLLRDSFKLDEKKFRASLHLHEYHSEKEQIDFWSRITKIPKRQFFRPYIKPHTGKQKRGGYQGCLNIKYYDANLAKEILGIGKAFLKIYGGVV